MGHRAISSLTTTGPAPVATSRAPASKAMMIITVTSDAGRTRAS
jgi:hypothetical protein